MLFVGECLVKKMGAVQFFHYENGKHETFQFMGIDLTDKWDLNYENEGL